MKNATTTKRFIKSMKSINDFCSVSDGNKKLKSNENVRFLIFNIPAVNTCPFRTALCEGACYAVKAETVYPDVLPSRHRNVEFTKSPIFVDVMSEYIKLVSENERKRKNRKIWFRIHESGDFYNRTYFLKWVQIAKNNPDVLFLAYTKSIAFINPSELPENLVIRASIWADTREYLRKESFEKYPIYTAFEKTELEKALNNGYELCECKDCATCGKCYDRNVKLIACEIH